MIIPIRCMGCGKLIADKWRYYQEELKKIKEIQIENQTEVIDGTERINTPEGQILNKLGLTKLCCRIHFLTHRDLIDKI